MWPFVVLGGAPVRESLSALVRNPHKVPNGETSRETGRRGGKEGPGEDTERKSTTKSRGGRSA